MYISHTHTDTQEELVQLVGLNLYAEIFRLREAAEQPRKPEGLGTLGRWGCVG